MPIDTWTAPLPADAPPDDATTERVAAALKEAIGARRTADDPAPLVAVLARHGALDRFVEAMPDGGYRYAAPWRAVLGWLAALGGLDLSLARLVEGHLNALQLVAAYGTAAQQAQVLDALRAGGMLGVWGADAAEPVRLNEEGRGRWRVSGAKRYASGAGLLAMALVPVTEPDGTMLLLLLDVGERARVDGSTWRMRGMRGSISGTYDFEGLVITARERVGAPDDYRREPLFVGGIWRCAAAQLGAIEAIVRVVARELGGNGRDAHPLQMARIGRAILAARTARLWIEDAAARVEAGGGEDVQRSVALSAYARLATEEAAMTVIDLAERALGLGSFAEGHPAEALTRDLAVYVRQANPDAVLLQHGRVLARELQA